MYKEIQIFKLEDVALQNHFMITSFYDHLQKSLSTTFDNYFHKTTHHHGHNIRGEKLNITIIKTLTYGLQAIREQNK